MASTLFPVESYHLPEVERYESPALAINETEKLALRFRGKGSAANMALIRNTAELARNKISKLEEACAKDGTACEAFIAESWKIAREVRTMTCDLLKEQMESESTKLRALQDKIKEASTISDHAIDVLKVGISGAVISTGTHYISAGFAAIAEKKAAVTLARAEKAVARSMQNVAHAKSLLEASSKSNVVFLKGIEEVKADLAAAKQERKIAMSRFDEADKAHLRREKIARKIRKPAQTVAKRAIVAGVATAAATAATKIVGGALSILLDSSEAH